MFDPGSLVRQKMLKGFSGLSGLTGFDPFVDFLGISRSGYSVPVGFDAGLQLLSVEQRKTRKGIAVVRDRNDQEDCCNRGEEESPRRKEGRCSYRRFADFFRTRGALE